MQIILLPSEPGHLCLILSRHSEPMLANSWSRASNSQEDWPSLPCRQWCGHPKSHLNQGWYMKDGQVIYTPENSRSLWVDWWNGVRWTSHMVVGKEDDYTKSTGLELTTLRSWAQCLTHCTTVTSTILVLNTCCGTNPLPTKKRTACLERTILYYPKGPMHYITLWKGYNLSQFKK